MSIESQSIFFFTLVCVGFLVPVGGLYYLVEYRRRSQRLPLLASFENLAERFEAKKREYEELKIELADLGEKLVSRDMAAAETEKWNRKKEEAENDVKELKPRLRLFEEVQEDLRQANESLKKISDEKEKKLEELNEVSQSIIQKKLEEKAKTGELANVIAEIEAESQRRNVIQKKIVDIERSRKDLEIEISALEEKRKLAEVRLKDESTALETKTAEKKKCSDEVNALNLDLASLEVMKASTEEQVRISRSVKDQLDSEIEEAQVILSGLSKDTGLARLEQDNLQSKVYNLEKELKSGSTKLSEIESLREAASKQLDTINSEITSRNVIKELIESSRNQDDSRGEVDPALALGNLLEIPPCLKGLEHERGHWSEMEAMEALSDHLKQLGLQFSRRILYAFHTNLKISDVCPLVVLAGISGTGKSELPRRYSEALGIHFLQVAVQPRWDSPQDLFGFYNYLEQNYRATELAQAMVCLDEHNWPEQAESYKNRLLMVLLDEMNLAKVEYYFSEFLSRLEARKSVNAGDQYSRRPVEISLELGSKSSNGDKQRVYPTPNILFVGTMNEDESTQSISEKVIDRAPVIRFARPKILSRVPPSTPQISNNSFLPEVLWKAWHSDHSALPPSIITDIETWIKRLNKALDGLGRPFGHRLNQAMMAYVANHPEVIDGGHPSAAKRAFADQLEQRIFPKLRGLEMYDDRNIQNVNDILKLVREDLEDNELADAFEHAMNNRTLFTWMGVKRAENDL